MRNPTETSWFRNCLAGLILLASAGCTSSPTRESVGEYLDSVAITTKVKAAVFRDPELSVLDIGVETFKGVVRLSGSVDAPEDKAMAAEIASRIEGVRQVQNDLIVNTPGGPAESQ